MLALLRDPAERAQSAYTFGLEACVCNFRHPWCTQYSSWRYKNRVHHLCDGHAPRHTFYDATAVLHGHHGVPFNPTSTDAEHSLGRYTRAVAREIYAPYFGSLKPQGVPPEAAAVLKARLASLVG